MHDSETGEVLTSPIRTSESIVNLAAALAKAQAALGAVTKSHTAKIQKKAGGSYSYTYAGLAETVEACRAPLGENGLCVIQPVTTRGSVVSIHTRLLHETGEWLETSLDLHSGDTSPQSVASAITYGRRYALQSLLGIPTEDDDGSAAQKASKERVAAEEKAALARKKKSNEQIEKLKEEIQAAETLKALEAVAEKLKKSPAEVKDALRDLYGVTKTALEAPTDGSESEMSQ